LIFESKNKAYEIFFLLYPMLFNATVDFLSIVTLLYLFDFQGREPVHAGKRHTQRKAGEGS
jgi:hypothetical protein